MKITYKKPDRVNFRDIEIGQTFFDEDMDLCIKIETRNECPCLDGYDWNCFSFSDNTIYTIADHTMVTPVNVELIIDMDGELSKIARSLEDIINK